MVKKIVSAACLALLLQPRPMMTRAVNKLAARVNEHFACASYLSWTMRIRRMN